MKAPNSYRSPSPIFAFDTDSENEGYLQRQTGLGLIPKYSANLKLRTRSFSDTTDNRKQPVSSLQKGSDESVRSDTKGGLHGIENLLKAQRACNAEIRLILSHVQSYAGSYCPIINAIAVEPAPSGIEVRKLSLESAMMHHSTSRSSSISDAQSNSVLFDLNKKLGSVCTSIIEANLAFLLVPANISDIIQSIKAIQFAKKEFDSTEFDSLVSRVMNAFEPIRIILEKAILNTQNISSGHLEHRKMDDQVRSPNKRNKRHLSLRTKVIGILPTNSLNEAIVILVTSTGVIKYVSPAIKDLFGYETVQIVDQTSIIFLAAESNIFLEAIVNGILKFCFKCKKSNGSVLDMHADGISNREGNCETYTWVIKQMIVTDLANNISPDHRFRDSLPNYLREVSSPLRSDSPNIIQPENIPNLDMAICQICERSLPALMFESHTRICLDIHALEMKISLAKDELKSFKSDCLTHLSLLREELTDESRTEGMFSRQHIYLQYLDKLCRVGLSIELFISSAEKLQTPKWDFGHDLKDEMNTSILIITDWEPPKLSEVECPSCLIMGENNDEGHIGMAQAVNEIANELFKISVSAKNAVRGMLENIEALRPKAAEYREEITAEEYLTLQIGTQLDLISDHALTNSVEPDITCPLSNSPTNPIEFPPFKNMNVMDNMNGSENSGDAQSLASIADLGLRGRRNTSLRAPRMVIGINKTVDLFGPGSPGITAPVPIWEQIRAIPSIKDYQIIKPISKGAFGSVFLSKRRTTGEYFAIKVLKKSEMTARNQAMNVRSERAILTQLDCPYVVKLFNTFQSKQRIYMVMEYLNGGDCAALLKSMGQLDESWARRYIAEMTLGIEYLHARDIVHRYE